MSGYLARNKDELTCSGSEEMTREFDMVVAIVIDRIERARDGVIVDDDFV